VLGSTRADDLREPELTSGGESFRARGAEGVETAVGYFTHGVVEYGGNDSLLHHLLHGITTSTNGVESNHFVTSFFKELDRVHGALSKNS
jgi:hypothetical protein